LKNSFFAILVGGEKEKERMLKGIGKGEEEERGRLDFVPPSR